MVRLLSAVALASLLALVLYLPSVFPPERFFAQLRIEHDLTTTTCGPRYALNVLDRALRLRAGFSSLPLASASAEAAPPWPADAALARHLAATSERIFGNSYFASFEAMLALALYRLAALGESFWLVLPFAAAALIDGLLRRAVKSKQFEHHHPEVFGACGLLILCFALATAVIFVTPLTLRPYLVTSIPLVLTALAAIALANFHGRG